MKMKMMLALVALFVLLIGAAVAQDSDPDEEPQGPTVSKKCQKVKDKGCVASCMCESGASEKNLQEDHLCEGQVVGGWPGMRISV